MFKNVRIILILVAFCLLGLGQINLLNLHEIGIDYSVVFAEEAIPNSKVSEDKKVEKENSDKDKDKDKNKNKKTVPDSITEYERRATLIYDYYAFIEREEKDIRELLIKKNKTNSQEDIRAIVAEVQEHLKSRKDLVDKYYKEKNTLKYLYPSKGKFLDQKYKRISPDQFQEFEDEVNKALSGSYNKVKEKYSPN